MYYVNPEKRVFSLNLIAFIEMRTGIEADLRQEGNVFYGIFPETPEIGAAIMEYRDDGVTVELHKFLTAFKDLRFRINRIRRGEASA